MNPHPSAVSDDIVKQLTYHAERFAALSDWKETSQRIADVTGSLRHTGLIGLDQMGHFGPHGCELVADELARRRSPISSIAELGSGYGGALRDVSERLRARGSPLSLAIGVEFVSEQCYAAQQIDAIAVDGVSRFVVGDAASVPLHSARLDAVFVCGSMPHFRFTEDVLAEAARVLKPSGAFVSTEEVSLVIDDAALPASFRRSHPIGVFHLSAPDDRRRALQAAGFDAIEIQDLTPWAIELVDARLKALRLLRGTAAAILGDAAVESIDETLVATLEAYRSGSIMAGLTAASASGPT